MTNKCKTCMHGYPNVECVNCGTGFRNYLPYTPPTNADRIRGMSDTELAEWICGVYDDDESAGKFINGILIERYDEDTMLDWLRQPSETEGME